MNKYAWILCVVGLLAPACAPKVNVEQQRAALMEADRAWAQTTTDTEKFMSYFAPDASVCPPGMPIAEGHDAILQVITGLMAMPGYALTWEPVKADVGASGDLAYTAGTYALTANDAAGTPMIEKGKYVTVWKKQPDGQWKAVHDIFNTDAPTPPPATEQKK